MSVHGGFLSLLAKDYGESPVASGKAGTNTPIPMMVFANPATGTWTIVAVVNGCAQPLASGHEWTSTTPEPIIPGEDA